MICQSVTFSELYEKILVTGGLAYIDFHLVVSLKNNGFDVLIVDDLSNSYKEVLDGVFKMNRV